MDKNTNYENIKAYKYYLKKSENLLGLDLNYIFQKLSRMLRIFTELYAYYKWYSPNPKLLNIISLQTTKNC